MIELAREVLAGIKNGRSNGGRLSGRRALPSTIGSLAARPPLPEMRDTRIRSRWLGAMLAGEPALASINARAADAGFSSR